MHITNFNDLLQAARYEPLPQRLLFVFTSVELPADSTEQQRADFAAGEGGTLTPLMCVDKSPQELDSFADLCAEAAQFAQPWGLVFAAAISGGPGEAPGEAAVDQAFQSMVEDIKQDRLERYIPFDKDGLPVRIG
jgi:hypothetical protein